ncbi:DEAD/DEAH box helicase family protein, partial [Cetobacterium sp.]|uniref:DEAD/DEAH box helicase family protein n=1 Tax=Cetobacterium sp. TaxID=2071632 RepID=UPI003EE7F3C5
MLISNNKVTMYESLKNSINLSEEIIINVSFIRDSGLKLLIPELKKARSEGKSIKILTSDYMNVTEPNALYRLLDIPGVKIFKNPEKPSFHPKTYIFKNKNNVEIYVGSSNISYSALISGVEWSYQFFGDPQNSDINNILTEFDELYEKNSFELTLDWLRKYEKNYKKKEFQNYIDPDSPKNSIEEIEPIKFQVPALYELSKTREEGFNKALVIVATGLGKTYLSAFDSKNFDKILFVAHRDEILKDAQKTFETIYSDSKSYGFFNGSAKDINKDIIFASVQTLSKNDYLSEDYFSKDYFDYIVVDEFHHSSAKSYSEILNYFKPKFLLGLTATPDRADSGDIYKLCDYNIAYECDLRVAINNGWLTPFQYFGIYDDTDYSLIPWRGGKYDLESLENSLIVEKRVQLVLEKYLKYRKKSTIAFCASVKHAKVMYNYFLKNKIKSALILGETSISDRQNIIKKFKDGKLDIIFTVDIFNEGIDIPCIDTVLFLRPTTSYTIFMQQLGRGLRTYPNKHHLRVLDFVGNYKGSELKPSFLTGFRKNSNLPKSPLDENFILPEGCTANFDFKIIEHFENEEKKRDPLHQKMIQDYLNVKEYLRKTPTIMDIYTFGEYPVSLYIKEYDSWYNFLKTINDLNEKELQFTQKAIDFLKLLDTTKMTKSYKIPLFLSLFEVEPKQSIELKEIGKYFKQFYDNKLHGKDLNNKIHTDWKNWELKKFMTLARDNPINFLTKDKQNLEFF